MPPPLPPSRLTHPALLLAGCVAAGIVLATRVGAGWGWGLLAAAAVAPWGFGRWWRRRLVSPLPLVRTVAVALATVAVGALRTAAPTAPPALDVARHAGESARVVLTGRIVGAPATGRSGVRLVVAADCLATGVAVRGRVLATLGQPRRGPPVDYPALRSGDVVELAGPLRALPLPRNPADFDYGAFLRRRGIRATLGVYDAADVRVSGHAPRPLDRLANPLRARITGSLATAVPAEAPRAVLTALLLGDRGGLGDDVEARFARTGLLHLLAVSGLHVLLVGLVLYGLLGPVLARLGFSWRARELTRCALTLAVLGAYVLVTGAPASVVRAVVMAALFMGATLLQRAAAPLNTLGAAALVLLLLRPGHLFEAGFQLSFSAVAALVTLRPVLLAVVPDAWREPAAGRYVVESVVTSLAATLGTLPVLLYHFGQVGVAGLVLNLPAIPLTGGALACGLAVVGLLPLSPSAAATFGAAGSALAHGLLATADAGDRLLGWSTLYTRVEDVWILAGIAALLGALAHVRRPLRWRWMLAALACGAMSAWSGVLAGRHRPRLDVVFFDVGQADAALVAFPNGRHLLVDTGADSLAVRYVLAPHLSHAGVRRLDAVLVTHPHADHLGGLPALLDHVPVGRVLHNGMPIPTDLYARTMRRLDARAVPHRAVAAGDTLRIDPRVRIHVLAPLSRHDDPNEASVVLRLAYGHTVWLFTGDAERAAEADVVRTYGRLLASDVVKVGHHGSRTSSTPAFVEAATGCGRRRPRAVVSVARRNVYGLPDEDVLARWHRAGAHVHRTSSAGAAWYRSDGRNVEEVAWRRPDQ